MAHPPTPICMATARMALAWLPHRLLAAWQLRFTNPLAEQRFSQYEATKCCTIDRLAYLVLIVQFFAGMVFIYSNDCHLPYQNVRTWAVPATYLLLLVWSSFRVPQYVANRTTLIMSARLLHWPSSTWLSVLAKVPQSPRTYGLWILLETAMFGGGIPSALVYGNFLRVDVPCQAIFQLWTVSRYMMDTRSVCSCSYLAHEGVRQWLRWIEHNLSVAGGLPYSADQGLPPWGGRSVPTAHDRCFAFLTMVQLLLGWGLPVFVSYLLDRSARRRWVRGLDAGEYSRLLTYREREYWATYDFLPTNVACALLALPLAIMVWRVALAVSLAH